MRRKVIPCIEHKQGSTHKQIDFLFVEDSIDNHRIANYVEKDVSHKVVGGHTDGLASLQGYAGGDYGGDEHSRA